MGNGTFLCPSRIQKDGRLEHPYGRDPRRGGKTRGNGDQSGRHGDPRFRSPDGRVCLHHSSGTGRISRAYGDRRVRRNGENGSPRPGLRFCVCNKGRRDKGVQHQVCSRIFTVHGKEPHTGYPRQGGGAKARKEVEAYFAANPGLKSAPQTLVLMPCEGEEYGPYYGLGTYCFAIDFSELDVRHLGAKNPKGKKFAKYFGGMAHEFGHAFGLPHNHATRSDEKARGTALMGHGNYTLGDSPTLLTPASAKILEVCDVFRADPKPATPSRHILRETQATFEKTPQGVRVRGKVPTPNDLHALIAYYDKDKWAGVNNNYDAESFVVPIAPDGAFDLLMPFAEIHPGKTPHAQAQLRLIYKDGTQELLRHTLDPKPAKEE